ncbi:precorrin-3B synthase [Devosia sp. CAU 1758]
MNHVHAIFDHSGTARRGACPTLDQPMQTGDGLLARLRVAGGSLTPKQLADIAKLAARHGNGLVEITARGNLQVRGLRPETAQPFARAITELLVVETGLVVDISPLAGVDPQERADPGPVARRIRAGVAGFEGRLGPKVSVVIDGGGQVSLAANKADIRLLALGEARWAVTLGGGHEQYMNEDGAVAAALALLGALAAIGPEARATDLFPVSLNRLGATATTSSPSHGRRDFQLSQGHTTPIALPFGQMDAEGLIALAEAADGLRLTILRLAPDHTLLIDNAPDSLVQVASTLGFVTDPADPRRRISACIGNLGCASGHIAARQIAARLALDLPAGQDLHVSGCAKGCAHPRATGVTLVGREDGIGLVINGRAGDTPQQILDETALVAVLAPDRDRR